MGKTPFSSGGGGLLLPPPDINLEVDMSSATWNTVGTHQILDVTGLVQVIMMIHCTENLSAGGVITFGGYGDTDFLIDEISTEDIDNNEFLINDGSNAGSAVGIYPAVLNKNADSLNSTINNSAMINIFTTQSLSYEISVSALTDGTLNIYFWWSPISNGAVAIAGDGS